MGVTFDEHVGDVHPGSQWCSCGDGYPLAGEPLDDRCPACRACIVPSRTTTTLCRARTWQVFSGGITPVPGMAYASTPIVRAASRSLNPSTI